MRCPEVWSTVIQIQRPNYTQNSVEKSSYAMILRMQATFLRCIATLRRCVRNIPDLVSWQTQFAFYDRMYQYLFICSQARRLTSRCVSHHDAMAGQRNLINFDAVQLKWTTTFGKLSTYNDEYKYPFDSLYATLYFRGVPGAGPESGSGS